MKINKDTFLVNSEEQYGLKCVYCKKEGKLIKIGNFKYSDKNIKFNIINKTFIIDQYDIEKFDKLTDEEYQKIIPKIKRIMVNNYSDF